MGRKVLFEGRDDGGGRSTCSRHWLCRHRTVQPRRPTPSKDLPRWRRGGVGLSIVSEAEYVADPEITMIRISDADIYTNAHVVCLRDRKEARLIRAFLDIAMNIQHVQTTGRS
jgi:hypothetical protein